MSKFKTHLGENAKVEIDGEEFELKPLTVEELPLYFMALKAFSNVKENATGQELLSSLDENGLKYVAKIIDIVLQKSYPDEPEEERKQFGLKYMAPLITKIIEMNAQQIGQKDKKLIEEIKAQQQVKVEQK